MAKTPKPTPASGSATPTQRLARIEAQEQAKIVAGALAKLDRRESLTAREAAAVKKWERNQLEKWGRKYIAATAKKEYCDAVGVSQKVALEQSRRFGLPYHTAGPTVDLFAMLAAWHGWASENKHLITRIIRSQEIAEALDEEDSLDFWQRELVKEKAIQARDAREERRRDTMPIAPLRELMQELVEGLHKLSLAYQRKAELTGDEAAGLLRERLEEWDELIAIAFAESADEAGEPTTDSQAA